MVEVDVVGVGIDNNSNAPLVLLKEKNSDRFIPIWIGIFEAQAIFLALEKITPQRPLTHDLLVNIVHKIGGKLDYIFINALKENVYYAKLVITVNSKKTEIDSRPSDALAIALRCNCPIYVSDWVLNTVTMPSQPINEEEVNKFSEWLKNNNMLGNFL